MGAKIETKLKLFEEELERLISNEVEAFVVENQCFPDSLNINLNCIVHGYQSGSHLENFLGCNAEVSVVIGELKFPEDVEVEG